ncbi:SDR family NAD(P)-dependent oxidoreductase [Ovoidimarina sediminis]|uniref:SDR family NAD(P)-dependent oxidoreductase n=1 Tax=Ovoidimarina sediminis TaxID=3079856 RepID=UPI00290B4AD5|nr:SDR family NAD(P)-dependent oxidoreductase [Rhodophyticola sp. MJ-SS7]MDU8943126.1 SDR family oxidoreductase [Rhodophyticola sp. MJ-SS7]
MQIDGTVALVTGAAQGLGGAAARALGDRGARVALLDLPSDRLDAHAEDMGGLACPADVTDEAAVAAAVARAADHFGAGPRIAVNCAGIGPAARIVGREGKLSVDLFRRVIEVNLTGSYIVMSHAARAMQALDPTATGERGVIVNTASVAFEDGQLGQAAYAASKGAIAAMALPAAREFARAGIRVVNIAPGLFHTPMMEGLPPETVEGIAANIPFPARLGDPSEYALLACQIVENPYLNGTTIRLDGAVRMPPR